MRELVQGPVIALCMNQLRIAQRIQEQLKRVCSTARVVSLNVDDIMEKPERVKSELCSPDIPDIIVMDVFYGQANGTKTSALEVLNQLSLTQPPRALGAPSVVIRMLRCEPVDHKQIVQRIKTTSHFTDVVETFLAVNVVAEDVRKSLNRRAEAMLHNKMGA